MKTGKFPVLMLLSVVALAAWIAVLWVTTGQGHPFCISKLSVPSTEALIRDGIRQHLERRVLSLNVIDPSTGARINPDSGPYGELPARAATVEAFLRAFPNCCELEPLGSSQSNLDRTVNLLINYEDIEVLVKDPTWREPYVTYGEGYVVDTCLLANNI